MKYSAEGQEGPVGCTDLPETTTDLVFFPPHLHPEEGYFLLTIFGNKAHGTKRCFASCADSPMSV